MGLVGAAAIGRVLRWCCVGGLVSVVLSGCASYQSLPLRTRLHLKHSLSELVHSGVRIDRPLSVYDVAVLAVENNPDLLAARAQRGVARAQVLEAGLLPNPSISASYLFLLNPDVGGALFDAVTAAVAQDIQKTITMKGRLRAAQAAALQVDASVLWEEWQLIGKARLAVFDIVQGEKLRRSNTATRCRAGSIAVARRSPTAMPPWRPWLRTWRRSARRARLSSIWNAT